jgi:hypothetical protein
VRRDLSRVRLVASRFALDPMYAYRDVDGCADLGRRERAPI